MSNEDKRSSIENDENSYLKGKFVFKESDLIKDLAIEIRKKYPVDFDYSQRLAKFALSEIKLQMKNALYKGLIKIGFEYASLDYQKTKGLIKKFI